MSQRSTHLLPRHLRLAAQVLGFTMLTTSMVAARCLVPTQAPADPDLVPILVGTRSNKELVQKVHERTPVQVGSTIHSASWTETGLVVAVSAAGPRVVVLLDDDGRASVAHVEHGRTLVHLAVPCCEPQPPYTVTVVKPRGSGGVLDARALPVASLR